MFGLVSSTVLFCYYGPNVAISHLAKTGSNKQIPRCSVTCARLMRSFLAPYRRNRARTTPDTFATCTTNSKDDDHFAQQQQSPQPSLVPYIFHRLTFLLLEIHVAARPPRPPRPEKKKKKSDKSKSLVGLPSKRTIQGTLAEKQTRSSRPVPDLVDKQKILEAVATKVRHIGDGATNAISTESTKKWHQNSHMFSLFRPQSLCKSWRSLLP